MSLRQYTIQEGTEYLVGCFADNRIFQETIRTACTANPTRSSFKMLIDSRPHQSAPVSARAGTTGEEDKVCKFLLENGDYSAPLLPWPGARMVYTGHVDSLVPICDPIVRLVDRSTRCIYNVSLPKHTFFPGFIRVAVKTRGQAVNVEVMGEGIGNWAGANLTVGPLMFKQVISGIEAARRTTPLARLSQFTDVF